MWKRFGGSRRNSTSSSKKTQPAWTPRELPSTLPPLQLPTSAPNSTTHSDSNGLPTIFESGDIAIPKLPPQGSLPQPHDTPVKPAARRSSTLPTVPSGMTRSFSVPSTLSGAFSADNITDLAEMDFTPVELPSTLPPLVISTPVAPRSPPKAPAPAPRRHLIIPFEAIKHDTEDPSRGTYVALTKGGNDPEDDGDDDTFGPVYCDHLVASELAVDDGPPKSRSLREIIDSAAERREAKLAASVSASAWSLSPPRPAGMTRSPSIPNVSSAADPFGHSKAITPPAGFSPPRHVQPTLELHPPMRDPPLPNSRRASLMVGGQVGAGGGQSVGIITLAEDFENRGMYVAMAPGARGDKEDDGIGGAGANEFGGMMNDGHLWYGLRAGATLEVEG